MSEGDSKQPAPTGDEPLVTMTFGEHLDELRRRLVISLAAVFLIMFFFLTQKDSVMSFVMKPYRSMWRSQAIDWKVEFDKKDLSKLPASMRDEAQVIKDNWEAILDWRWKDIHDGAIHVPSILKRFGFGLPAGLISITPLQDIMTFMFAAVVCAIAVASPILLHQMWRFIAAGLYKRERRAVLMFLPGSIVLFMGGLAFGYLLMVPYALFFLFGLGDPNVEFMPTIRDYFWFLFMLTVALGFVFQLPVVMVGLVQLGLTTPRFYIRYWRHCILAIFVIASVLTPPDPVTIFLMGVPMTVLFLAGLGLSVLVHRRKLAGAAQPAEAPA
jgi:Tat protein translocase TatC